MFRFAFLAVTGLFLFVALPGSGSAQEWTPPAREMPAMPQAAELNAGWLSSRSAWFAPVASLSGVAMSDLSVAGSGRSSGGQVQVARVTSGPLPVVVWQDRNGDGRTDLIEIYRNGSVVLQVIDAEYDGEVNVVRRYDSGGGLVREDRL